MSLNDMTKSQLTAHAKAAFNVELEPAMTRDEMIRVLTDLASRPAVAPEPEPAAEALHPSRERMFKLLIHEQEGDTGNHDVTVGVNGKVWQIKRGFEVVVPESVIHTLGNCVVTQFTRDEQGNLNERHFNRFSYQSSPL